jgi:hypothetical protein
MSLHQAAVRQEDAVILFLSQAPTLCALLPALIAIALLEGIGLKVRHNILILSIVALALICTNFLLSTWLPGLAALLAGLGTMLAILVFLYTMATARRGKQRRWFVGLLAAGVVTLGGIVASRAALPPAYGLVQAEVDVALAFVPPLSTLAYGIFAQDFARVGGRMRR